ncbi:hypothetical protein ASG67_14665 [Sphingomonas sp. Leaf339]|nr:hypothetical protein ASG67_14665 [Sphingomonas sp. Leaf339]
MIAIVTGGNSPPSGPSEARVQRRVLSQPTAQSPKVFSVPGFTAVAVAEDADATAAEVAVATGAGESALATVSVAAGSVEQPARAVAANRAAEIVTRMAMITAA